MSNFKRTITTQKGHELMAKMLTGVTINFTRITTSEHEYSILEDFELEALTIIENEKQSVLVSDIELTNESYARVHSVITNTELIEGYYVKAICLYANDPSEGEILYSITVCESGKADWFPPFNEHNVSSIEVNLDTVISNADNVSLEVNPAALISVKTFNKFKDEITSQMNDIENEKNFQTKAKKTICSIIFDDGWIWDYTIVLPYFKSIGIVGNTAMFSNALAGTNYLQRGQLKELEDEGWSILSHTAGHINCATSTESQLREDFEKSIRDIKACGVKRCDYLVYPFNYYSLTSLNVTREYFKGAFAKSRPTNDTENEFNTTPLNQYAMYRVHAETPLSEIKSLLDKAIANNAYIVLMAHSHYYGNTAQFPDSVERFARLKENIKYLMDNGVEILGVNEAMDRIGNIVTIGDKEISQRYYFQSKDGSIASSDITENIQNGIGITSDTPITAYPRNEVTTHSFTNTSASAFPVSNAGVLVTYRPTNGYANDELSFQLWYPNGDETRYYKRIWLSSEKRWFIWQEFKSENSKKKIQLTQNSLTLQHQYTMTYKVEGLLTSSYISLVPGVELPDDVIIQPSIVEDGVLKVKIYNFTTNNIPLPTIKYNLIIH